MSELLRALKNVTRHCIGIANFWSVELIILLLRLEYFQDAVEANTQKIKQRTKENENNF